MSELNLPRNDASYRRYPLHNRTPTHGDAPPLHLWERGPGGEGQTSTRSTGEKRRRQPLHPRLEAEEAPRQRILRQLLVRHRRPGSHDVQRIQISAGEGAARDVQRRDRHDLQDLTGRRISRDARPPKCATQTQSSLSVVMPSGTPSVSLVNSAKTRLLLSEPSAPISSA